MWWGMVGVLASCGGSLAQVIHFESGDLAYQTLSRSGLTVMFAVLPSQVREYSIVQATVTNGSDTACAIRPEDFAFRFPDGQDVHAEAAETVVMNLLKRAGRNDVIKLVATYEIGLYGLTRFKSTSGYEKRRQAAQAALGNPRLTAAAAASAMAFVEVELKPGESTDGALFFPARGRRLAGARLRALAAGELLEFDAEPDPRQP